jgi:cytoskeletal protein CcmA (bactofilin family)
MEFDLSNYKIMVGSINVSPREDPINGPNGTAVTTRFNNFVEGVQGLFNQALPYNQGGLITLSQQGKLMELARGASNFCLVASPVSESGLAYEPRVDLTSDQVIGGKKTFTSLVNMNGFISKEDSQVLADLLVDGTLSVDDVLVNDSLLVRGDVNLHKLLNVGGNTSLKARLDVSGLSTFGNGVVISQGLTVNGGTSLGSNLSVGGPASFNGTVSVQGLASLTSLEATGYVQAQGDITGRAIKANTNLTVTGSATIGGDLILASGLNVKGTSSFGSLTVDSLTSKGTVTAQGGLNVVGPIVCNGTLTANSAAFEGAISCSEVTTQDLTVSDTLLVNGFMSLPSGLEVGQRLTLEGDLFVSGVATLQSPLSGTSANFTSTVNIGNTLSTDSIIVRGSTNLTGSVTISGGLQLDGPIVTKSSANISGAMTLGGPLTTTNAISASSLTVVNASIQSLTTNSLKTDGDINATGNIIANGNITSNSLNTNQLEVQGASEVNDLTVNGNFVLANPISIPGLSGVNTGDEVLATPTKAGVVLIDSMVTGPPVVYTQGVIDTLFVKQTDPNLIRLDGSGYIPEQYIPPKAFTKPFVVASEGGMLSLIAQEGDIAIRSDIGKAFILSGQASQLSNWLELSFNLPSNIIQKVFGRVGEVQAEEGDYSAQQVSYSSSSYPTITNVHGMLGQLNEGLAQHKSDPNPHQVTIEQLDGIPMSMLGIPQGVAPLDTEGYVTHIRPTRLEHSFTQADISNGLINIPHSLGALPIVQVITGSSMVETGLGVTVGVNQVSLDLSSLAPISGTWKAVLLV